MRIIAFILSFYICLTAYPLLAEKQLSIVCNKFKFIDRNGREYSKARGDTIDDMRETFVLYKNGDIYSIDTTMPAYNKQVEFFSETDAEFLIQMKIDDKFSKIPTQSMFFINRYSGELNHTKVIRDKSRKNSSYPIEYNFYNCVSAKKKF